MKTDLGLSEYEFEPSKNEFEAEDKRIQGQVKTDLGLSEYEFEPSKNEFETEFKWI